ncbi:unnamed protein product, partial [Rotaria sp. Silwood1]
MSSFHYSLNIARRRPAARICERATWTRNATTVAGGHRFGVTLNQLACPLAISVDANQNVYVADPNNDRIVKWDHDAVRSQVVAGGHGTGNNNDQLYFPRDIAIDNEGVIYIYDHGNQRIQRWRRGASTGNTFLEHKSINCIAVDDEGSLYVLMSGEVRKWRIGEKTREVIGSGLNLARYMTVDRNGSVYVSEEYCHRVIKLDPKTKQISVVAGGSQGNGADQFNNTWGVAVDQSGSIYVSDYFNHRVMRWLRGATFGEVIAGGRGQGSQPDQLYHPADLSFDLDGNLYVVDSYNNRVQKFLIDTRSCDT